MAGEMIVYVGERQVGVHNEPLGPDKVIYKHSEYEHLKSFGCTINLGKIGFSMKYVEEMRRLRWSRNYIIRKRCR